MQSIKQSIRNVALTVAATNTFVFPLTQRVHDSGSILRAHFNATQVATLTLQSSVDGTTWVQTASAPSAVEGFISFFFIYPHNRAVLTMGATAGTVNLFGVSITAA